MKKVAIIGAGIVGATAAYYLSKDKTVSVTVFDEGKGQATKAAAGIISPWFSKRRHKAWYRMARLGADFYPKLVKDLAEDGFSSSFYKQSGIYLLKKRESRLEDLFQLVKDRRQESPLIGEVAYVNLTEAQKYFPDLKGFNKAIYASGAARVDGSELTKTLLAGAGCSPITKKVSLEIKENTYLVDGDRYDAVILATGAWLPEILDPLGYEVDVRPQKGQLLDYYFENLETDSYPVLMPEGELDVIPFGGGKVSVGASHENDMGYDLSVDDSILEALENEAKAYYPNLSMAVDKRYRIGTRAYTSDFAPFYGQVPGLEGVFAVSGLGSSGLTTGPLIAHEIACLLTNGPAILDYSDYPIERYIIKKE
ncbi:NAD(P)/FAD-dependent oxidoreductase [Streptococcus saliviloxodontae]|uniref:Glycine/D-amino acid oxidase-like deaminating enzyme n=1 Tax=Streptococcus saliviloxodontae TaxID=1349416 RepID=A0ABS2PMD3_9STRE|nr:FAD-dependent oxidoreductase [Streptococcus saliviloxodontae]MBM7636594.1 glycine/D-amino acid oxidase-like deaminating enzyme [Streptococcus saliviloxodontae]